MRLLLLLALCASAAAAPLPPMPAVKRPAPLLSPAHAAVVKSKPMVKAFQPAAYPAAPILLKYARDVNYTGCDTNTPGCVLYDITTIIAIQRAGVTLTIEFADTPIATHWTWVAIWGPTSTPQTVEAQVPTSVNTRPLSRFYRARESVEPGLRSGGPQRIQVANPMIRTRETRR